MRSEAERLTSAEGEIRNLLQGFEQTFLRMSESLEALPKASGDLVHQARRLIDLAIGCVEGENLLDQSLEFIQQQLNFLGDARRRTDGLVTQLTQASEEIARILECEAELQRTIRPLAFLQIYFRIEASTLDTGTQQMFLSLVEEIHRLNNEVKEMFAAKFAQLRGIRQTLLRLIDLLTTTARREGIHLASKTAELEALLARLKRDVQTRAERDLVTTKLSRTIEKEVGDLVISLQSQDILSQKLNHVITALSSLAKNLAPGPDSAAPTGAPQWEPLAIVEPVLRVQVAQLAQVQQEFETAHTRLSGSIQAVVEGARRTGDLCIKMPEFEVLTVSPGGLIQTLLDANEDLRGMLKSSLSAAHEIHTAVQPIGGLASNVTSTIRELSANIRLIALNSQIQAALSPDGRGLEVLAARTAGIAIETASVSQRLAEELDRTTQGLGVLVANLGESTQQGEAFFQSIQDQGARHDAELHQYRDTTFQQLALAHDSSVKIVDISQAIQAALAEEDRVPARIQTIATRLDQVAASCQATLATHAPESTARAEEMLRALSSHYTMRSEWAVHEAAARGLTPGKPSSPAPTADAPVEAPLAASPAAVAATATATETPSATAPEAKTEFGDNVDLF